MLKLTAIEKDVPASSTLEVKNLTDGVVSIQWVLERNPASPPLHWRAGRWEKPPVDLRLDARDGRLRALQVVLQDELPQQQSAPRPVLPIKAGLPLFDLSLWTPTDPYVDEKLDVLISWSGDDQMAVDFGGMASRAIVECRVGERLGLLFDQAD